MGDRSNIFFRNVKGGIGVYGHWAGVSMATAAMAVINNAAFKQRIGDCTYATRIGVQTVLEHLGALATHETGFGLWSAEMGPGDNEHKYIVIDVGDGSVYVAGDWDNVRECELVPKPDCETLLALMSDD